MKQIISLLSLRAKQGYRYLNETGFAIIGVALFILTGIILKALQQILTTSAYGALLFALVLLIFIEVRRGDKFFLKSIFPSKIDLLKYKFIENILITLPILVFQVVFHRWDIMLYVVIISGLVSLLNFNSKLNDKSQRKISLNKIPLSLFEVKFYFENKLGSMIFILLILCLGVFHISLWILGIFALCMVPLDIFISLESREMIHYNSNFVLQKIINNVSFFLILITVPTLITLIFSPEYYIVIIYGIVSLVFSIILPICKKYYSFYGVREMVSSTTSTVILIFLMLAPGGILITLTACIYYYIRAENHMKKTYAIT